MRMGRAQPGRTSAAAQCRLAGKHRSAGHAAADHQHQPARVLVCIGGRRDDKTAQLARELAAAGDAPSAELRARVRDPVSLALSYGSGLLLVAVLALMIWKPGA